MLRFGTKQLRISLAGLVLYTFSVSCTRFLPATGYIEQGVRDTQRVFGSRLSIQTTSSPKSGSETDPTPFEWAFYIHECLFTAIFVVGLADADRIVKRTPCSTLK